MLLGIAIGAGGALAILFLWGFPLTAVAPAIITVMLSLLAVRTGSVNERILTTGLMPLAATAGIALSTAADALGGLLTGEVLFLVVIVVAVILRRFGPRATALGTIGFMGFFLALFLQATPDMILPMGIASLCGAIGALLARFVILREPARATWRRAVEALVARVGTLRAEIDARLLGANEPGRTAASPTHSRQSVAPHDQTRHFGANEPGPTAASPTHSRQSVAPHDDTRHFGANEPGRMPRTGRANERVAAELMRLNDTAVSMGSGFPFVDDLPAEQADEIRGRVLDVDLAATELVAAVRAGGDDAAGTPRYQRAVTALDAALNAIRTEPDSARDTASTSPDAASAAASSSPTPPPAPSPDPGDEQKKKAGGENTRTAVQALLAAVVAMVVGNLVSPSQWFWAVVTSFLVFTGTASRGELAVKAWSRTIGTLGGVVAGVIVAALLDGLLPLQIIAALACIFLAIYLQPLSFALMTFFVTTLLGVVYSLLGSFSVDVLVLRLVETAIGAAAGLLAGAIVLPTRTRDVVRSNTAALLTAIATFLTDTAAALRSETPPPGPDAVDEALQKLLTSAQPIGAVRFGDSRVRFQRWRALVWWLAASTRRLARGVDRARPDISVASARSLADLAATVAEVASAAASGDYDGARERATASEDLRVDDDGAVDELVSLIGAIRGALVDLAEILSPRRGQSVASGARSVVSPTSAT